MESIEQRLDRIEFHQKLLMKMLSDGHYEFYRIIVEKQLQEKEVEAFYKLCEKLSEECEEQKADNFVFFSPLFKKFKEELHSKLDPIEVIQACIKQNLYPELMKILLKNIPKS
ncbi:DUF1878 family protein [Heyndrickxia sp. NPDC080065]|uniref:DUF1878 family protein n=1 Tax=Heyndrickxia sp. NPDC080065 TaxID=3390568 RepID=UPI003CFEA43B